MNQTNLNLFFWQLKRQIFRILGKDKFIRYIVKLSKTILFLTSNEGKINFKSKIKEFAR